jgi:DDE superfamily endonuclease
VGAALAGAQKQADDEAQVIVWVDQSGFSLLPHHVRTWARQGQTPVLRVPLTRDHRAAMAAITADQRRVLPTQTQAYHRAEVVRCLRVLLRRIPGKLLILSRWSPQPSWPAE